MGITIDLGLSRFYYTDEASWPKALEALVESKLTNTVRDVMPGPKPKRGKRPLRVYEAKRVKTKVVGRWLDDAEATPLLTDWNLVVKAGGSACWSYDDFEALGISTQQLELVYDKKPSPLAALIPDLVTLPGVGSDVRCADVTKSTRQWSDFDRECALVCMMHDIATRHRLVVHCA
jgi:hypothetical protein